MSTFRILTIDGGGIRGVFPAHILHRISTQLHMYPNGTLCLYDHRAAPWSVNYNLHETIIPWTAEWLVFYELYKIHNKWLGPEAPHGDDEAKEPQRDAA